VLPNSHGCSALPATRRRSRTRHFRTIALKRAETAERASRGAGRALSSIVRTRVATHVDAACAFMALLKKKDAPKGVLACSRSRLAERLAARPTAQAA
jgi:hypothetical protein